MREKVNKIISSIKVNPNFLVLKKFFLAFLRNYFKFHIRLLYAVSGSKVLYSIYIFLMTYSIFGCKGNVDCNISHYVALLIALYVMGTSIELYILCYISRTRIFLDNLVGKDSIIKYKAASTRQFLKIYSVVFVLTACDIITAQFEQALILQKAHLIDSEYFELYGSDGQAWDKQIGEEYLQKHRENLQRGHGLITWVAHKFNI